MISAMSLPPRLARFVDTVASLVDAGDDEMRVVAGCSEAMRHLVAVDDWLPEAMAKPHPKY
jgi:3-mercaptopropionate dioxygenase